MKKRYWAILAIALGYPIYIAAAIFNYSTQTTASNADVAIVLGAAVWKSQPSPVFKERINHAIKLYHGGQVKTLLFTGGIGDGDTESEATVAKRFAVLHGVPSKDILIEETSTITLENIHNAYHLMQKHQLESALLVSDPLHMKRAMMMAKEIMSQIKPSPTTTSRFQSVEAQLKMLLSETYYYIGHQLRM